MLLCNHTFDKLQKPERDEWGSGLDAMQAALALEKNVNQSILDLHKLADTHGDSQVCSVITSLELLIRGRGVMQDSRSMIAVKFK